MCHLELRLPVQLRGGLVSSSHIHSIDGPWLSEAWRVKGKGGRNRLRLTVVFVCFHAYVYAKWFHGSEGCASQTLGSGPKWERVQTHWCWCQVLNVTGPSKLLHVLITTCAAHCLLVKLKNISVVLRVPLKPPTEPMPGNSNSCSSSSRYSSSSRRDSHPQQMHLCLLKTTPEPPQAHTTSRPYSKAPTTWLPVHSGTACCNC